MNSTDMPLWKDPSFLKYYLFNVCSYFGSGMTVVALPLFVYEQSQSPIYTSLVAVFTGLPYLLFGLFAGAMADRGNRKAIMVTCNMFCFLLLGSVPLAMLVMGQVSTVHLLGVGLLASTAFVWFDAASHGALLQLVGRSRLVAANSLLTSTDTIVRIGSPVAAGFIIYHFGPEWALGIDAVCYLAAALLIISIAGSFQADSEVERSFEGLQRSQGLHGTQTSQTMQASQKLQTIQTSQKSQTTQTTQTSKTTKTSQASQAKLTTQASKRKQLLLRTIGLDIKEGLSFIWSEPLIRSLTLLGFGNSFIGGAVSGLIVVFGAQVLGFADSAPQMGVLFTCGSIGALVASLSLPLLRKRFRPGRITLAGLVMNAVSLLGVAMGGPLYVVYASYILWNLCYILVIVNGITLRQQLAPDHLQSRVHASGRMIAWGGLPFGSLLGGIAAEAIGVQLVYGWLALVMLFIFFFGLMTPLSRYELK
ncbi:MFS transporter [Paenibacillus eucommiae]|uniref:MFS family permease n=1 Tax=Paenibacillus eucommiae TaxID=1355755 RepID=A0ABS4IXA9_9BACL|nr:MFS transporter [Paenibacillus eucommiae]MBP1992226.1 MFS family permease [Paenibacillus eucommiae]